MHEPLLPMIKMHQLHLHKQLLRELFSLPDCNYNCMIYSPADYLCNTPRHKTNTCRKNLGELIFARMHAGPVFALARVQENSFQGSFSTELARFLKEFNSVRIHVAPVFAPARIQKTTPGELFYVFQKNPRAHKSREKSPPPKNTHPNKLN